MADDLMPAAHPAFSPDNPWLQVVWDATSLELLMRDPWTYYCTIIEGWRTPYPSAALVFGRLYGEALGVYCIRRLKEADHEEALDYAAGWTITKAFEGDEVLDTNERLTLDEIAANSVRAGDRNQRDTYRLLRAVIWWCDEYGDDPLYRPMMIDGRPAVEVHFDIPLDFTLGGHRARLCGHLDSVVTNEMDEWVIREWKHTTATITGSRKSAMNYFLRYKPNVQINTYALAGRLLYPKEPMRGVLVEACQTAVTFAAFEREDIPRAPSICDEWRHAIGYRMRQAEELACAALELHETGGDPALAYAQAQSPPSMRQYGSSMLADAAYRLPNLRRQFLQTRGVKAVRWDPTQARELDL